MNDRGWQKVAWDARIAAWAGAARGVGERALRGDPEPRRCGGTWAVGLDLLANEADGSVAGVAFPWAALPLVPVPLHRGQLSAVYPGYPRQGDETAAAFGFRLRRDAAHLDGVLPVGPEKRRMIKEPHAWILGLPLTDCPASPLVVWEGSHELLRAALMEAVQGVPADRWSEVDLTPAYQAARARVFETCRRVELPVRVGEATLLHRLCLHGVAPWGDGGEGPPEGRIIAYFRPQMSSVRDWILEP